MDALASLRPPGYAPGVCVYLCVCMCECVYVSVCMCASVVYELFTNKLISEAN